RGAVRRAQSGRCERRPVARCDGRTPHPHRAAVRRHIERHAAGSSGRHGPRDPVSRARWAWCAAALLLTVLPVACGPKNPDYQSIWTTTSSTAATPTGAPVPFSQYLESSGVSGEPVAPDKLTDLTVSIPTPPGWHKADKPNIPPTTEAIP